MLTVLTQVSEEKCKPRYNTVCTAVAAVGRLQLAIAYISTVRFIYSSVRRNKEIPKRVRYTIAPELTLRRVRTFF